MRKLFFFVTFLVICFLFITPQVTFAFDMAKDYTLPYPPQMPGNFAYKIRLVQEKFDELWSFGSMASFQYDLKISDKYLVQAKTLLEYQQYLLSAEALNKSNVYFEKLAPAMQKSKDEGKNISEEVKTYKRAAQKHVEVLTYLKTEAPSSVTWRPEKAAATNLSFTKLIDDAIALRQQAYEK